MAAGGERSALHRPPGRAQPDQAPGSPHPYPRASWYTGLPSGHPEGWNDALYQAINAFYRSILDDTAENAPYATIPEGAWIMKIIEACLASDKLDGWVDVKTGGKA